MPRELRNQIGPLDELLESSAEIKARIDAGPSLSHPRTEDLLQANWDLPTFYSDQIWFGTSLARNLLLVMSSWLVLWPLVFEMGRFLFGMVHGLLRPRPVNKRRAGVNKKVLIIWSICSAVTGISGCASDVANRYYLSEKYPPKSPTEVAILWERPSRDFQVIADFQSRGESPKDMQEKAASIGADAVIVAILGGSYSRSEEWAGQDREGNTYTRITGTAIKFR